ncbi:MAG: carbonic anhydrase [Gammaproteobacteria bacterium]|nr:carbonic anhydrase [Gammaproteobacteria bacterium]
MIDATTALARLKEGNLRFAKGQRSIDKLLNQNDRMDQLLGQQPFAIILGCSDSRVPAEIVFDQGLGDLFVIRVAGNIVAPSQVGSVEFAAVQFSTRLVVVMGHTHCGAVKATLDEMHTPKAEQSKNIRAIVDRIQPALKPFVGTDLWDKHEALYRQAIRANIDYSVHQLQHSSSILEALVEKEGLLMVGAEYDLQTSKVEFFAN